jgi:phosphonate transport system substrate-binding protein
VDGLVWEYFQSANPELTRSTRIILKSEPFAIPPVVASREFPLGKRKQIGQVLLAMHLEAEGRQILQGLMIDRFIVPPADWFENTREIQKRLAFLKERDHGAQRP